jgi:hypothetical protein
VTSAGLFWIVASGPEKTAILGLGGRAPPAELGAGLAIGQHPLCWRFV